MTTDVKKLIGKKVYYAKMKNGQIHMKYFVIRKVVATAKRVMVYAGPLHMGRDIKTVYGSTFEASKAVR